MTAEPLLVSRREINMVEAAVDISARSHVSVDQAMSALILASNAIPAPVPVDRTIFGVAAFKVAIVASSLLIVAIILLMAQLLIGSA